MNKEDKNQRYKDLEREIESINRERQIDQQTKKAIRKIGSKNIPKFWVLKQQSEIERYIRQKNKQDKNQRYEELERQIDRQMDREGEREEKKLIDRQMERQRNI